VRKGLSDGTRTVVEGLAQDADRALAEGQMVISGRMSAAAAQEASSSPFGNQSSGRRPGPPSPGGF
jgi:hypothetical protein